MPAVSPWLSSTCTSRSSLIIHTGRLTDDLAEVVDYLRVVTVRRGHLDGHDRLLPGGQPRAGLGLGEGQGEQSVMLVVALITAGHLPGGQDGGGGVGRRGDLAKVLDGLGGHRYLAGHLSHRFISFLRPISFCEKKKNFLVQVTALQNMQIWKGEGQSFFSWHLLHSFWVFLLFVVHLNPSDGDFLRAINDKWFAFCVKQVPST